MNSQPHISVLMPVYNASAYLREAMDSILQQTFSDFELIAVDDGSTDDSAEIIKNYSDDRIRLISGTHDFISSLNKGIGSAAGKYIARMDADDVMMPHRLETQFELMETHPDIDICGSYAECFGIRQHVMQGAAEHRQIVASLLLSNSIIHPTVILRRSIFENNALLHYPNGYPCAEDYKLWTVLAAHGFRFAVISEVLLRYRRSLTQVTERNYDTMRESALRIQMEYAEQVMERVAEREERYSDFFNRLIALANDGLIGCHGFVQTVYQVVIHFMERNNEVLFRRKN